MPNGTNELYTDEECRAALLRVAEEVGGPPTRGNYVAERRPSEPAVSTVCDRVGDRSWADALAAVGLDEDGEGGVTNVVPGP